MNHVARFMDAVRVTAIAVDHARIEVLVDELIALRDRPGRLFVLGVGGSAANASHAVNDFRKLCGIESYAPSDNVAELTARTNDEGWATVFSAWLKGSQLTADDAIFILSVGGGDADKNISLNIVRAVDYAKAIGATILGIVGRFEGYTAQHGDVVLVVPKFSADLVTPLSESFQSVLLHCVVSHPQLCVQRAKWESVTP